MDDVPLPPGAVNSAYIRSLVRQKLEAKGVERVRAELAEPAGFPKFQLDIMREWLVEKRTEAQDAQRALVAQAEREARIEAANLESLRLARSAKNASWFAAIVAAIALPVTGYAALREFPAGQGGSAAAAPKGDQGKSPR
jgi:predicted phage tail protein